MSDDKKYTVSLWDIQFYKVDEDGNELLNDDGSIKLFTQTRDIDLSWIADSVSENDIQGV
tara:strand:+ start:3952 stop:4131 length:180 start_codon:yes stop_codon:yes gene_type:complete